MPANTEAVWKDFDTFYPERLTQLQYMYVMIDANIKEKENWIHIYDFIIYTCYSSFAGKYCPQVVLIEYNITKTFWFLNWSRVTTYLLKTQFSLNRFYMSIFIRFFSRSNVTFLVICPERIMWYIYACLGSKLLSSAK